MPPNERPMIGVREEDRQYRRGMVLGLTMAEIMLLLIFLLLMLLAAKLLADREAVKAAMDARDAAVAAQIKAEEEAAGLREVIEQFRLKDAEGYDLTKEYRKVEKELADTRKDLEEAKS